MPFDFPASPTNGQTISGPNGIQYRWDGTKWTSYPLPTQMAPVNAPVFTGDAQAVTPAAGDADTSIATTAFVQAAVAPALHDVGRNLLHNALFNVQQRGTGPWTATGNYTADRWVQLLGTGDTISTSITSHSDASRAQIGDESAQSLLNVTFTGSANAAGFTVINQRIENTRRLSGKTVTVSFWAAANSGTPRIGLSIEPYYGSGGTAFTPGAGQSVVISTAWTRYSFVWPVPSMSGITVGTAGTDYVNLFLWLSSGANNANRSGNVGVQSGQVFIWGIQLEIGSVATPVEKLDPRMDWANCQRFYQTGQIALAAYQNTGFGIYAPYPLPVQMRAAPTVVSVGGSGGNSGVGAISWVVTGNGAQVVANPSATASGPFIINQQFSASADL